MGKPVGNGMIELVDEKSSDRGFFCMKQVGHISEEVKEQLTLDCQDLWELRFNEAKKGISAYRDCCPIHVRTIAKRGKQLIQLTFGLEYGKFE